MYRSDRRREWARSRERSTSRRRGEDSPLLDFTRYPRFTACSATVSAVVPKRILRSLACSVDSSQPPSWWTICLEPPLICLFAYEYAVTFDREVDLFWKRRITVSSILFLINRYVPFVVNMFYAPWPLYPTTYNGCAAMVYSGEILEIFQYLPWAVFSALRAYVLTSRGRFIAGFVFLLALVPVVINYVTLGYATPIVDPLFGCYTIVNLSNATQQDFTIISRISLITSDLLLMGVTWLATYKTSRQIKALNQVTSLSSVLFRDGVIYFIVLAIMNVLHLSFSLLSILNQNDSPNASYITILTEPITAILISRFLIDLQEANVQSMHQHSLESVSTLDFNGVIGSVTFHLPAPGEDPSDITHSQGTSMSCAPDSDPDVQMSARCSHEDTASNTV